MRRGQFRKIDEFRAFQLLKKARDPVIDRFGGLSEAGSHLFANRAHIRLTRAQEPDKAPKFIELDSKLRSAQSWLQDPGNQSSAEFWDQESHLLILPRFPLHEPPRSQFVKILRFFLSRHGRTLKNLRVEAPRNSNGA